MVVVNLALMIKTLALRPTVAIGAKFVFSAFWSVTLNDPTGWPPTRDTAVTLWRGVFRTGAPPENVIVANARPVAKPQATRASSGLQEA